MIEKLIKRFLENPTYLTNGAGLLSRRWNCSKEEIYEARREAKVRITNASRKKEFKRLFFDIETSYNIGKFWSTGYNKQINPGDIITERAVICVSYKWEGEDIVHNITWDENQCDKKLLQEFSGIIREASEVIGHNGDRFDIPWIRTRCLIHRIPFPTYVKSLDTLLKARSQFNFQSNKLDYLAKVLKVGAKVETGGMELWDKIILQKDQDALDKMVYYCNNDVIILEEVFNVIQSYIKPNTHVGVHLGNKKWGCPICGTEDVTYIKPTITQKGVIQRQMFCNHDKSDYIISNTIYKKYKTDANL
jgi:uncharacterized protein YprB with RNaseH-like and TPR domain